MEKLGHEAMEDMGKRWAALTQLARKHTGELVAFEQTRDY